MSKQTTSMMSMCVSVSVRVSGTLFSIQRILQSSSVGRTTMFYRGQGMKAKRETVGEGRKYEHLK